MRTAPRLLPMTRTVECMENWIFRSTRSLYRRSLSVGDVLLTRGDMIHRTQDSDTDRVVLSFRAFDDSLTVTRDHFQQTTPIKELIMQKYAVYEGVKRVFEDVEELPLSELLLRTKSSG